MIVWSDYYRFSAEEVEAIAISESRIGSHPFMLTVYFKSGNKLSISYADMKSRKEAMLDLSRQIDIEKRQDTEKIHNSLYILNDSINRIDKRQLRIWKQLKALLGGKVDNDGNQLL